MPSRKLITQGLYRYWRVTRGLTLGAQGVVIDGEGRILPDCKLVPHGTTARQLAYKVHTDLGEHFVRAVDARTKRTIGADHVLNHRDIVRVVADV